uniref:RRM domain-containing protein n=1 Tax=Steinernema glaseri TaxID=37863 RepID=A0A1I7Y351_9BILA
MSKKTAAGSPVVGVVARNGSTPPAEGRSRNGTPGPATKPPEMETLVGSSTLPARDVASENDHISEDGSIGCNDPGKMFIGGLSWQTTAEGLRDYFSKFGEVNECMVMRDPATKRARKGGYFARAFPSTLSRIVQRIALESGFCHCAAKVLRKESN